MKSIVQENSELKQKIDRLERNSKDNILSLADDKKKRHRRSAREIERHFKCPAETCPKSYGSEGSLAQHIKLKHPEYFKQMSNNMTQSLNNLNQGDHTQNEESKDTSDSNDKDENHNNTNNMSSSA